MDESQVAKNPEQPSRRKGSILKSLKLDFFDSTKQEHIKMSINKFTIIRGFIDVGIIVATFILAIFVLNDISKCNDHTYRLDGIQAFMAIMFVLATLLKIGIFLVRLSSRAQKILTESKFFFLKAMISLYYCSHLLPALLVDVDDCEDDHPFLHVKAGISLAFLLILQYLIILILTTILCIIAHKGPSPYLKTLQNILKVFTQIVLAFIILLTIFIIIFIVTDLQLVKPLVVLEFTSFLYYLMWTAYYTFFKKAAPELSSQNSNKENKV